MLLKRHKILHKALSKTLERHQTKLNLKNNSNSILTKPHSIQQNLLHFSLLIRSLVQCESPKVHSYCKNKLKTTQQHALFAPTPLHNHVCVLRDIKNSRIVLCTSSVNYLLRHTQRYAYVHNIFFGNLFFIYFINMYILILIYDLLIHCKRVISFFRCCMHCNICFCCV